MGLGSTKNKIIVNTQIQRVIEDDQLPNTLRSSVLRTILSTDPNKSLGQNISDDFSKALCNKVKGAYKYAKDNYTYGLPVCNVLSDSTGAAIVTSFLEAAVGSEIEVLYFKYQPINSTHVVWKHLIDNYGYDEASNKLTSLYATYGADVYLKDIVPVYTQESFDNASPGVLEQWGYLPNSGYIPTRFGSSGRPPNRTPYLVRPNATYDYAIVTYVYKIGGAVTEVSFEVPITGFTDNLYYQVKYSRVVEGVTQITYWIYEDGSGVHPVIDAIAFGEYDNIGEFYPFIHFREDKVNLGAPELQSSTDYQTSKRLMLKLGMDYQAMIDSIHENPDIAAVEQATMLMAVPMECTHEVERKFLFEFFTNIRLYDIAQYGEITDTASTDDRGLFEKIRGTRYANERSLLIKDREFAFTLSYGDIKKISHVGSVAAIGEHTSGSVEESETVTIQYEHPDTGNIVTRDEVTYYRYYSYCKQVSSNIYEEIRVYRPQLSYHIYGKYKYRAGFGADALIIPLDHSIVKHYSNQEKEKLYALSFHFIFNTREVIKVKWYQSIAFKFVVYVIAVVYIVFTWDVSSAYAAIAAMGVKELVITLIKVILTNMALQWGFEQLAEAIGGNAALIIAAVATVVALGMGYNAGSLKGAPWATELLTLANGLVQGSQDVLEDAMKDIQKEMAQLSEQSKVLGEQLKQANSLLTNDSLLSAYDLIRLQPLFLAGESPDDYYHRTIHSGNVGVIGIEAVSSYTESALSLPKAYQSLMES